MLKMWMVNLIKNLLPCNFQSLGLQCEQLLFGHIGLKDAMGQRCDGPVFFKGKGRGTGILEDFTPREPSSGPWVLCCWGTGDTKTKKGGGRKKENLMWRHGRLKGRFSVQLQS